MIQGGWGYKPLHFQLWLYINHFKTDYYSFIKGKCGLHIMRANLEIEFKKIMIGRVIAFLFASQKYREFLEIQLEIAVTRLFFMIWSSSYLQMSIF